MMRLLSAFWKFKLHRNHCVGVPPSGHRRWNSIGIVFLMLGTIVAVVIFGFFCCLAGLGLLH